ncbi:MAG: phosphoglycerate mutase family protein [Methylibium sp.]|uniref:phosphoglycerate mutase family protein n=1 Tax=Methylibium sp. TaxID=2067992 RepID=UPI001856A92C|nr:phosphoglycerate mutase family protein [Methylibium sp.]MBA3597707.1 phosphoglycerate mutase family protein [Methylibium sp.]
MAARTIMVIRHAEKPDRASGIGGVRADGAADPQELSVRGWQRAGALVRFFAPVSGQPVLSGLQRPQAIFAASAKGKSTRPLSTVGPLAAALGLTVHDEFSSESGVPEMIAGARASPGPVLICWRHGSIPSIARSLVGPTCAPSQWSIDRFDLVWLFQTKNDAWTFEQLPQLLLAGDRSEPIPDGR